MWKVRRNDEQAQRSVKACTPQTLQTPTLQWTARWSTTTSDTNATARFTTQPEKMNARHKKKHQCLAKTATASTQRRTSAGQVSRLKLSGCEPARTRSTKTRIQYVVWKLCQCCCELQEKARCSQTAAWALTTLARSRGEQYVSDAVRDGAQSRVDVGDATH